MNDRIRELMIRSNPQGDFSDSEWVFEKFAELIVRECAEICHRLAEDSNSYVVHDGDTCATQIKKHFGVE